jgi:hypothetical protein
MFVIQVELDVTNPVEVVKNKKGRFAAFAANFFMSREKLKTRIEDVMSREMIRALETNIEAKLRENGVEARYKVKLISHD